MKVMWDKLHPLFNETLADEETRAAYMMDVKHMLEETSREARLKLAEARLEAAQKARLEAEQKAKEEMARKMLKAGMMRVMWDKLPLLLNETQAASILGVSVSYLRKGPASYLRKGHHNGLLRLLKQRAPAPPFVVVGRRRYYRASDLKSWVDNFAARTEKNET
ncbi:MAG: hypothetical protein LBC93_04525 [Synergistaceae bacterium]|jgi:hypothetical protein|nr:hypothetical protein [Synergistaceae bacterium]